ncbi:MAG: hypothetical protein A2X22_10085 [Bacteroidetes bacterium GWF2_49_14]|nr:MAG: hypothetical protein A2X22_10085 [Bacteroidetes bacterium GWF2_49_14]HBB92055.1 sulfatase [Bacteroidales bacterium]
MESIRKTFKSSFFLLGTLLAISVSCKKEVVPSGYLTRNVVIVIMDGARYTETLGDSHHHNMPRLADEMANDGVILTDFRNRGETFTIQGHAAISTGNYVTINNGGTEAPPFPSIFQEWLAASGLPSYLSWIISSKDKLSVLSKTTNLFWFARTRPSTDCGIYGDGLGSGYREDSVTFQKSLEILAGYVPNLVLISFKQPDVIAHAGDWPEYLHQIQTVDEYIYGIWNYINTDPNYKGTTTLFVTNDHGRHEGSADGDFVNHGDSCEGCTHLMFYACGPDFKKGVISGTPRELIDISATIAKLMGFTISQGTGKIMEELFR